MPPRIRTQSAGRPTAESLRGGPGERVGKGRRGRSPREGNDERVEDLNGQRNDQGFRANEGVEGVNGNVEGANRGGAIVLTRWIEKMENIQDMSGCSNDQKVKYTTSSFMEFCPSHEMQKLESELWNHAMVGAGHAAYTDRFYELARLVPHLVTPESRMIKRSACPRMNRAQEPKGNHPNQVAANNGGQGHGNQGNQARGRAFMLGAEEARQDPNIVMGTFTLNDHFATTLFESGADYSFVSTTFIPLLGLEPSNLGFRYEIEIASGKLVEIDKVIKGCKLEIEGHVFDIDLIPFEHGSFDVIIGMDWLSNYKAEIIYHEKVVRIPPPDGKVLRVVGERPEEKVRLFMSAKASDKKQEEIIVVRDFPEVFPDDLFGLPPIQEIEFRIELIPRATPVAKSPYRLAPSEM
ncbi:putative reverse transcriptase domain-containing protein [Tanacetum coccineum]